MKKQTKSYTPSGRDRPVEIEITPQMIEAGVSALSAANGASEIHQVEVVYRAMVGASCRATSDEVMDALKAALAGTHAAARVLSEAFDKVRAEERARIVAWLRTKDAKRPRDNWFAHIAQLIEQGAHDNG